jgi:hypothetical protein
MTDDDCADALNILTGLLRAKASAPKEAMHLIEAKDAAFVADVSESRMRELCALNIRDGAKGTGYAFRQNGDGPWQIELLPFLFTLRLELIPRVRLLSSSRTGLSVA